MRQISLEEWRKFTPAQRARIAAVYLNRTKLVTFREAISNNALIADPALSVLEVELSLFIKGFRTPPWDMAMCKNALEINYKLVFGWMAMKYYSMKNERKAKLMERGKAFLAEHLPGIDPMALLEGRV